MDKTYETCKDFVDDCFDDQDLLYKLSNNKSFELWPSQLISESRQEEGEPRTCLVSLRDEPKIA